MKILVTGMTQLHAIEDFYLRQQLKVVPSELALVRLLREAGHEVVQQPVSWGEDLDEYERIITYICGCDSFSTMYTDGALWTLKREDTLLAFDDWQTDRTLQDFGRKVSDSEWRPHDTYTMRQARREGFIGNVLQNYVLFKQSAKAIEQGRA